MKNTKRPIEFTLEQARNLYKTSTGEFKSMLELNFTQEELKGDITDIIKNWDNVITHVNMYNNNLFREFISTPPCSYSSNYLKLKMLEFTLNEGEVPKLGEERWYPYFEVKNGGLVFYRSSYLLSTSDGSVAYFKTKKLANFAGKNFTKLFENFVK